MRRYSLASTKARDDVDLCDYSDIITNAVKEIMPKAYVDIFQDYYIVDPSPTQGQAVKIGRLICQSDLSKHCIHIPKLFTSKEVKEVTDDGENGKHPDGGHH